MFFAGLIVAGIIALTQVDLESMRGNITSQLRRATGLPVEIRGDIKWSFSLRPRIALHNVAVRNASWAKNPDGFRADTVYARLDLLTIFSDQATVTYVNIVNPQVFIEKNERGEYSMQSVIRASQESEEPSRFPFGIDVGIRALMIKDLKLNFITPESTQAFDVGTIDFSRSESDDIIQFTGDLTFGGQDFDFVAAFTELNKERKVYPVRIAIANNLAPITINLALEQTSLLPIDFRAQGEISDARGLAKMFGFEIPKIAAIDFDISGGMGRNNITFRNSTIAAGNNDLTINSGNYNWSRSIPTIDANISSTRLVLAEVLPELYGSGKWKRPNRPLNVFKDTPLFAEYLNIADGNIALKLSRLQVYRNLSINNIDAQINLNDGAADIRLNTGFADGAITARVLAGEHNGDLDIRAAGRGKDIYISQILAMVGQNKIIDGLPVDLEFYLDGHGKDLSQLMSTITGPVRASSSGSGTAMPTFAEYLYGQDFLTSLRHSVTDTVTGGDRYDHEKIKCMVANIKLRGGVMDTDRGIAMQTAAVNMRAAGNVNLGAETLHLSFASIPVRGLRISISGNIVNAMELSGSMAEPDLKLNSASLVQRAATATGIGLFLAPFTGGLSLIAGAGVGLLAGDLVTNWLSDSDPCQTAFNSGAPAAKNDPAWMSRPLADLVDGMLQ